MRVHQSVSVDAGDGHALQLAQNGIGYGRFADAAGLTRQTHGQLTGPARFSFHGDTWQDT